VNIAKKLEELTPEVKEAVLSELKKYSIFSLDVKNLDAEQLAKVLTQINKEEVALNNKVIQLQTQLQEKKNSLSEMENKLKEKYNINNIEDLKGLKEKKEKELQKSLAEIRAMM